MSKKKNIKSKQVIREQKFLEKYFTKDELQCLGIICGLGFLIRVLFIFDVEGSPFVQNLFSDSKIYYDWAKEIVSSGNWVGSEVFFMSPGYPYFLAIIFKLTGNSIDFVRIIQALISTFTIPLVYLTARNLFEKRSALIAAFLASIYSGFIFYSVLILGETIQIFLAAWLLYLLSKNVDNNYPKHWFYSGLILGLTALFRANILIFVITAIIWLVVLMRKNDELKKLFKKTILYLMLGTAIPILPITIRNYLAADDIVLLSSNGGINFFLGNNKDAPGIFKSPKDFDLFQDMAGIKYAKKITGKNLKPSESSDYWYQRGLQFITHNPGDAFLLSVKKILLFFDNDENPQSSTMDITFYRHFSSLLKIPFPDFLFVIIFAIAGMILFRKEWNRHKLVYLFLISYIISTVMFFIIGRFRLAAMPIFIVFAGAGIKELIQIVREKEIKRLFFPSLGISVYLIILFSLTPKFNFSNHDAYVNLGNVYFDQAKYNDALNYFNQALYIRESDLTYVLVGNTYAAKRDSANAVKSYQKAISLNPDYALAYFNLGSLYSQNGNFSAAENAFLQTIKIDPYFDVSYRNLAIIYYMGEEYEKSLSYFQKYLSITKDEQAKVTVLQDIEEIKRRLNRK